MWRTRAPLVVAVALASLCGALRVARAQAGAPLYASTRAALLAAPRAREPTLTPSSGIWEGGDELDDLVWTRTDPLAPPLSIYLHPHEGSSGTTCKDYLAAHAHGAQPFVEAPLLPPPFDQGALQRPDGRGGLVVTACGQNDSPYAMIVTIREGSPLFTETDANDVLTALRTLYDGKIDTVLDSEEWRGTIMDGSVAALALFPARGHGPAGFGGGIDFTAVLPLRDHLSGGGGFRLAWLSASDFLFDTSYGLGATAHLGRRLYLFAQVQGGADGVAVGASPAGRYKRASEWYWGPAAWAKLRLTRKAFIEANLERLFTTAGTGWENRAALGFSYKVDSDDDSYYVLDLTWTDYGDAQSTGIVAGIGGL